MLARLFMSFGIASALGSAFLCCKPPQGAINSQASDSENQNDGEKPGTTTEKELDSDSLPLESKILLSLIPTGSAAISGTALTVLEGGEAASSDLHALKHLIAEISICKELESDSANYQSASGCLSLYRNAKVDDAPSASAEASDSDFLSQLQKMLDFAKENTAAYIDFADPEAISAFESSIKLDNTTIGIYPYGIITWYPVLKVKAEVLLGDERRLHTKVATPSIDPSAGERRAIYLADDLTVEPAEETLIIADQHRTWFSFLQPFSIAKSDIKRGVEFKIALTIDPDAAIKGIVADGAIISSGRHGLIRSPDPLDSSKTLALEVPLLHFVPLVHHSDEAIMREDYLIHLDDSASSSSFDIRLRLFYRSSSMEKEVSAVEMLAVKAFAGTKLPPILPAARGLKINGDLIDVLVPKSSTHLSPLLHNFKRLSNAGDSGSMHFLEKHGLICLGGDAACETNPAYEREIPASYELIAIDQL